MRILLLGNLLTNLDLRLHFVRFLQRRADFHLDEVSTARHVDALCHAWTLADNLLSVYEILAERIDLTNESQRRAILSRTGGRTTTPTIRFHKKIWLYSSLAKLPDEVFERVGIDRATAERVFDDLIVRSCSQLQRDYEVIASYHRRYRPIAAAYKHGRALFPLRVRLEFTKEPTDGECNVARDKTLVTAFQPEPDGTETVVELTPDHESAADLRGIIDVATQQLPRLLSFVDSIKTSTLAYLEWLEGPREHRVGPGPTFCFFAEPYTPEEEVFIKTFQAKRAGQ